MTARTTIEEVERRIRDELARIADPEIPAISVVDLGVIGEVRVEEGRARIDLMPTFVGCPAIGVMEREITDRISALGVVDRVDVVIRYEPPWTSDRITPEGRERLRRSGFAPPQPVTPAPALGTLDELAVLPVAECPYCGSRNTTLENPFGPTLCRAIYHCAECRQPFEQFKRV